MFLEIIWFRILEYSTEFLLLGAFTTGEKFITEIFFIKSTHDLNLFF